MSSLPELTCIACPLGCRIAVAEEGGAYTAKGHGCARGKEYAIGEAKSPARMLTSVVTLAGRERLLPVRTARPVPKGSLFAAMEEIRQVCAVPPVKLGQVLRENLAGTGVCLVSTRSVD